MGSLKVPSFVLAAVLVLRAALPQCASAEQGEQSPEEALVDPADSESPADSKSPADSESPVDSDSPGESGEEAGEEAAPTAGGKAQGGEGSEEGAAAPPAEDAPPAEAAARGEDAGGAEGGAGPSGLLSEEERRLLLSRKDPFVAGLLSWFMMGIGQIYCKEYFKGSLFIAGDLTVKVSLVLLVSHINSKYAPESGTAVINWDSFDDGTKALIITYFTVSLGLRFFSTIDAVRSANKYNERLYSQRERSGLSFSAGPEQFAVSYAVRWNH